MHFLLHWQRLSLEQVIDRHQARGSRLHFGAHPPADIEDFLETNYPLRFRDEAALHVLKARPDGSVDGQVAPHPEFRVGIWDLESPHDRSPVAALYQPKIVSRIT